MSSQCTPREPIPAYCWVRRYGKGPEEWRAIVAYSVRDGMWYVYTSFRHGDDWATPMLTGGGGFKDPESTKKLVERMQTGLPRGEWAKEPGHSVEGR